MKRIFIAMLLGASLGCSSAPKQMSEAEMNEVAQEARIEALAQQVNKLTDAVVQMLNEQITAQEKTQEVGQ